MKALKALLRQGADDLRFHWPIYDLWRYLKNSEARRLYEQDGGMSPTPVEQRAIAALRRDGLAIVELGELLPNPAFATISTWAEELVSVPAIRERIAAVERGAVLDAKGGKYYIVRPLGDRPMLDVSDFVVMAALSDPVLRIVCGYLGMLARISAMDLWYSVASTGPEMLSQRWHRDPEDRALVKTFLYLRDCREENGPFCYVVGSHNAGPFRHKVGRDNYPEEGVVDRMFPPERRKACSAKAGTLIFCDTTGFHKGGHATSGARYLFNTVYTSSTSEPIARRWTPQCSVSGSGKPLGSAARYALGWVGSERQA
jgi:ectoine hydroxylase-related dioxygenase (phytanoyl-CoA dioxygenase family)